MPSRYAQVNQFMTTLEFSMWWTIYRRLKLLYRIWLSMRMAGRQPLPCCNYPMDSCVYWPTGCVRETQDQVWKQSSKRRRWWRRKDYAATHPPHIPPNMTLWDYARLQGAFPSSYAEEAAFRQAGQSFAAFSGGQYGINQLSSYPQQQGGLSTLLPADMHERSPNQDCSPTSPYKDHT